MALVLQNLKSSRLPVQWCLWKHHGTENPSYTAAVLTGAVSMSWGCDTDRAAQYVASLLQRGMTSAVTLSSLWGRAQYCLMRPLTTLTPGTSPTHWSCHTLHRSTIDVTWSATRNISDIKDHYILHRLHDTVKLGYGLKKRLICLII